MVCQLGWYRYFGKPLGRTRGAKVVSEGSLTGMTGKSDAFEFEVLENSGGCDNGTKKILVVDDDAMVRMVVAEMLRCAGYEVLEASGGEEAVELAKRCFFDAVITDETMPGMQGSELAAVLAALSPQTGVVLVTGWEDARRRGELPPGVCGMLPKPIGEVELLEVVRAATENRRGGGGV
jgi:CheY-like chemotaxis protein